MTSFLGIALVIIVLAIYFLPTIVAGRRYHNNMMAIFVVNLFLGWTFLGWVGALVWSCTNDVSYPAEHIQIEG
jgi:hypothetical protein